MTDYNLDDLRAELDSYAKPKKETLRTPREERIIAGFEEIEQFFEEHNRPPRHGENNDIFERLYAVRLDKIRASEECRNILKELDKYGLLEMDSSPNSSSKIDADQILAELSELKAKENDVTKLTHVKPRQERRFAEEIAQRTICKDFNNFKLTFEQLKNDLDSGIRTANILDRAPEVKVGDFYILFGQIAYVADYGEKFTNPQGRIDARLRIIFDNGTESNMLMTSLQRALHKDESGRKVSEVSIGPMFSDQSEESDIESGIIYVLRSKSENPIIKENRTILHKIGVTGGNIESRIANAKNDPTFLMDDVEVIATYRLSNINRVKLEHLIHKYFASARFGLSIKDRFGKSIEPREWYLVPLFIIDEAVERIKSGTILNSRYDVSKVKIVEEDPE